MCQCAKTVGDKQRLEKPAGFAELTGLLPTDFFRDEVWFSQGKTNYGELALSSNISHVQSANVCLSCLLVSLIHKMMSLNMSQKFIVL